MSVRTLSNQPYDKYPGATTGLRHPQVGGTRRFFFFATRPPAECGGREWQREPKGSGHARIGVGSRVTIAVCYISPEGVVLGADSTSTYGNPGDPHYYNNAQKLFEIGEDSTLGLVTWGLGGLQVHSHRTLIARLSDDPLVKAATSVQVVAERWSELFWNEYSNPLGPIAAHIAVCRALNAKSQFDANTPPNPLMRTEQEEKAFSRLYSSLVAGFCISGYMPPDRTPMAFQIVFDPLQPKPTPVPLPMGYWFWGVPKMIKRTIFGADDDLKRAILDSGKWAGTPQELDKLIDNHILRHPVVPIRDAIDFVHSVIYGTIKAIKFSNQAQTCGGAIEIAVITTDRRFRWVRHKPWDAAITEGDPT